MQRVILQPLVLLAVAALSVLMFGEILGSAVTRHPPPPAADHDTVPRLVVLVFDGVDHRLAKEYIEAGALTNLAALAKDGAFHPLASEIPPESPVALASLATGVNPGRHLIFDFVLRGPRNRPDTGMIKIKRARFINRVPVRPPIVSSRLAAPTFTQRVWEAGYSVLSLREALLFPVPDRPGARMTSGLGTPDLAGSAGFYTIYSNRLRFEPGYTIFGGLRVPLERGTTPAPAGRFVTWLPGPQDPTLEPAADGGNQRARVPLRFDIATQEGVRGVNITLQGEQQFIPEGGRSEFFSVKFELNTLPLAREVRGIVRFEVRDLNPLEVMADPVQIDPRDALFPISTPESLGREISRRDGLSETMGWQEQTFALNDRFQSDAGFLDDLLQDMDRGQVTLLREMARVRPGHTKPARLVFYTFTATDRACHCFWRYRDPGHPEHDERADLAGTDPILTVFKRMDRIVGEVRKTLDSRDVLLICSDHGFQTWRWEVHVNQWLVDNGYMTLTADAEQKSLGPYFTLGRGLDPVDWGKTKAFALGLGQIYINLRGRDETGIVPLSEKRALMEEICSKLLKLENPYRTEADERDGIPARAVRRVWILEDEWDFGGKKPPDHVPDLQIGFERGYRISWQTALLGGMGRKGDVFVKNRYPWSGDHCSTDRDLVPGVLFCNFPIPAPPGGKSYSVRDIAATALAHFGLDLAPLGKDSRPIPILSTSTGN